LTAQLRCYVPEPVDETWGRLRHLGARREQLIVEAVSQIQQMRDLLECVWPAALDTAKQPFRSRTWAAAMWVILDRDGGDFTRTRRLGAARFEQAVRREITKRGGQKPSLRILRALFAALGDPAGVIGGLPMFLVRRPRLPPKRQAESQLRPPKGPRRELIMPEYRTTIEEDRQ
jgi:transposase